MNDEKFKEYWENRTVADIMEEWGEQRDEWKELIVVKDGDVVKSRDSNGKKLFIVEEKDGELEK